MCVCVVSVFVLLCVGRGLATGHFPVQSVVPNVKFPNRETRRPWTEIACNAAQEVIRDPYFVQH
jgi:hypothetical protein